MTFSGASLIDFLSLLWLLLFIIGAIIVICLSYWVGVKLVHIHLVRKKIDRQNKKWIVLIVPFIFGFVTFGLINIMYTGHQQFVFAIFIGVIPLVIILFAGSYAKYKRRVKLFDGLIGHYVTNIHIGSAVLKGVVKEVDDNGIVTLDDGTMFPSIECTSLMDEGHTIQLDGGKVELDGGKVELDNV